MACLVPFNPGCRGHADHPQLLARMVADALQHSNDDHFGVEWPLPRSHFRPVNDRSWPVWSPRWRLRPPTRTPNPASGERQVSGTPSGIRGCLTRELLAIVDADVDPPVYHRVVRVIGGRKNLRRPVGSVDDPSQESKRALRGVKARIACPVS